MYYFDIAQIRKGESTEDIKDKCKKAINIHINQIIKKYGRNLFLGWTTKSTFGYVYSDFKPETTGFRLIGKGAKRFFELVKNDIDYLILSRNSDHLSYILTIDSLKVLVVDIETFRWLLRTFSDQRNTVKLILNKFNENDAKIILRWFKSSIKQMKIEELGEITRETPILSDKSIIESVKKNPSVIKKFSEIIESSEFDLIQKKEFNSALYHLEQLIDAKQKDKISELIASLSAEDAESIDELNKHLKNMTLTSINKMISITHSKIDALNKFKEMLKKEDTYEVKGHGSTSVHEFLEDNPWFMGERFELYKSEKKIKQIIKAKLPPEMAELKPDFVLLSKKDAKEAIVLEIKRPKNKLGVEDVQQVLNYKKILKENMHEITKWSTILVGGEWKEDLKSRREDYNLEIKSYIGLYGDAEDKLTEYLKVYEARQEDIT